MKSVLDCQLPRKYRNTRIYAPNSCILANRVRRFPCTHLIKFGKNQPRVEQSDLQILTNARDYHQGFYSIIPPSLALKRPPSSKYLLPHPHGFKWFRCWKGEQEKARNTVFISLCLMPQFFSVYWERVATWENHGVITTLTALIAIYDPGC